MGSGGKPKALWALQKRLLLFKTVFKYGFKACRLNINTNKKTSKENLFFRSFLFLKLFLSFGYFVFTLIKKWC